jgi:acetolactate synthase I/II/III large subunit
MMETTGARHALKVAEAAGVEVCFANPGTTEMDWVTALDEVTGIRAVLCLFEGVATGAADGYGRIAGKPALTLLHLGPGFANGIANLHNARRAGTPVVNLIGDHATWHLAADAPLTSDIESLAAPVSKRVIRSEDAQNLSLDLATTIAEAMGPPSGVATLIAAQDAAWAPVDDKLPTLPQVAPSSPDHEAVARAADQLKHAGDRGGLLLGGILGPQSLEAAARIEAKLGSRVILDTFVPRLREGRGVPAFAGLPYFPEQAQEALSGLETLAIAGTRAPVAFFGYKHTVNSTLAPDGCPTEVLSGLGSDPAAGLVALADALEADPYAPCTETPLPPAPNGDLDAMGLGLTLAHWLPDDAIVINEAATSGLGWAVHGRAAAPHDVLNLTGGAIGQGIPNAVGAAIAAPHRRVVALQADGSGMYTLQGLWTLAREDLDVTVIVCANRAYRILQAELGRSSAHPPGPVALGLTELSSPHLEWTRLAEGMGVPACQVSCCEDLRNALQGRNESTGPYLIEALL